METGLIITAYIVGQIIVACFLKGKIKTLRTQVQSQSEIITNVERYMKIADMAIGQVSITSEAFEKRAALEKERVLKEIEDYKTKTKKMLWIGKKKPMHL